MGVLGPQGPLGDLVFGAEDNGSSVPRGFPAGTPERRVFTNSSLLVGGGSGRSRIQGTRVFRPNRLDLPTRQRVAPSPTGREQFSSIGNAPRPEQPIGDFRRLNAVQGFNVGRAPDEGSIGRAPGPLSQSQQTFSGQDINRILKGANQFEATTGREVTGQLTEGLSRAAFGEAADRAAQNRDLALREDALNLNRFQAQEGLELQQGAQDLQGFQAQKGLELNKFQSESQVELARATTQLSKFRTAAGLDLQRFGLDANTAIQQANFLLQKNNGDRTFALNKFSQDLQAQGLKADDAFRLANQAIDVAQNSEALEVQRFGLESGLETSAQNASARGGAALGTGLGALLGFAVGGPTGAFLGAQIGGTAGGGLGGK